ncbi:MAG TPA: ABC transporter ATP-binding protein [Terriglobia bacterium]|nr:ABC transporter ATP-binding protein [Terriglobia bacterium]
MPAIEIKGLTKEYRTGFWKSRTKLALNSLNLQVESGEVFGLLGPNGAGKTTTLKILFRLVFPTSGAARILGRELNDTAMHQRVGYLPEQPYFYDHLTPEELLNYTGRLFRLSKDGLRHRVNDLLARLQLAESRHVPLRRFSKGMLQRVGIAQALINDPEVVFLDEPMTGLDPIGRHEVRDLVLQLREERKTVFFSTHILSDAETLCDRIAILNKGQLEGCGELHDILSLGVSATEVILESPTEAVLNEVRPLVSSMVRTGDRVRLEIREEANTEQVLAKAFQGKAKVVSLNPVKMSLEDYFLSKVKTNPRDLNNRSS